MNINDFTNPKVNSHHDKLTAIFNRQKELMGKYHSIEESSGLLQTPDCPVDIHSSAGQARLKDFSWRITEELMEALEAYHEGDTIHFHEELIDALHFMIEQHILCGFDAKTYQEEIGGVYSSNYGLLEYCYDNLPMKKECKWGDPHATVERFTVDIIESMGLAMNCLKNKPWKQSHMLTDVTRFRKLVIQSFFNYLYLMDLVNLTPLNIYNLYFRKSEVNLFRQKSNY